MNHFHVKRLSQSVACALLTILVLLALFFGGTSTSAAPLTIPLQTHRPSIPDEPFYDPSYLITDGQFVIGDHTSRLDVQRYLESLSPVLGAWRAPSGQGEMGLGEIVRYTAHYYLINPQVLLALLDVKIELLSAPPESEAELLLRFSASDNLSIVATIDALGEQLYDDYHAYFAAAGLSAPNAATYALSRQMTRRDPAVPNRAGSASLADWQGTLISITAESADYLLQAPPSQPVALQLDPLRLPYEHVSDIGWRYNKTPHNYVANSVARPWSAVDFGVPAPISCNNEEPPLIDADEWVVAAAAGSVVYSNYGASSGPGGLVIIDHGDGFRTHYLHLAEQDLISPNQSVLAGTRLGHPSCAPGGTTYSTGIHLHFAVSHSLKAEEGWGGYVPIQNTILSGWRIGASSMMRLGESVVPYQHIDDALPLVTPVILYRDAQQINHALGLYADAAHPESFDVPYWFDNEASSIVIPGGVGVTLYENTGTGGARRDLAAGLSDFAGQNFSGSEVGLNDNVSSVKVSFPLCVNDSLNLLNTASRLTGNADSCQTPTTDAVALSATLRTRMVRLSPPANHWSRPGACATAAPPPGTATS